MFKGSANTMPAPGAYNPSFREKQLKYSMRQRIQDHSDKWTKQVPGPGTYSTSDLFNEQGRNFVSKY